MTTRSFHGRGLRGLLATAAASRRTGRFGRLFPGLPPCGALESELAKLATAMVLPAEPGKPLGVEDEDENPTIPAGYTYLGQFIDHDITFDTASVLDREQDPEAIVDFRTPRLDLDSMYGRGPADQPYMYEGEGPKLAVGKSIGTGDGQRDLPRSPSGVALIGDPRNDENLIVAQIHATMVRFHNRRCDDLKAEAATMTAAGFFARVSGRRTSGCRARQVAARRRGSRTSGHGPRRRTSSNGRCLRGRGLF